MPLPLLFTILISLLKPVCSCIGVPTIQETFQNSAYVFSGTVLSIEYIPDQGHIRYNADTTESVFSHDFQFSYYRIHFKPDLFYKGLFYPDTLFIHTPVGDAACGYHFQQGSRYIVYAWTSGTKFLDRMKPNQLVVHTGICSRTQYWKQAEHGGLLYEQNKK